MSDTAKDVHQCPVCAMECGCNRDKNNCWHECADCDCGHEVSAHELADVYGRRECIVCSCIRYTSAASKLPQQDARAEKHEFTPCVLGGICFGCGRERNDYEYHFEPIKSDTSGKPSHEASVMCQGGCGKSLIVALPFIGDALCGRCAKVGISITASSAQTKSDDADAVIDSRWTDEAMRLLDLYVRGFVPIDVARVLVDKYRIRPENIDRDIFDRNSIMPTEEASDAKRPMIRWLHEENKDSTPYFLADEAGPRMDHLEQQVRELRAAATKSLAATDCEGQCASEACPHKELKKYLEKR